MKKIIPYLFICFASLGFISCKKSENTNSPAGGGGTVNNLSSFTVSVLERGAQYANISWTESINLTGPDTVKYKLFLNNRLIASNLINRTYHFTNLSGDTAYNGKVFAYTNSGDTISASFNLEKVQGVIAFNSDNNFEVYNIYSGTRLWSRAWYIYGYTDGSPTIIGDTIFFSNASLSTGNTLYAYSIKTGQQIWGALPAYGIYSSLSNATNPVYSNGKIIVSTSYGVIAINSGNGQILWTYSLPNSSLSGNTIPIAANNKVFVGGDGVLVALNENTGQLAWQFAGYPGKRPLPLNNALIVGTNNGLYSLNQNTGAVIWQKPFPNIPFVESDNVLIGFVGSDALYGLSATDGSTKWRIGLDWLLGVGLAVGNKMCFYTDNGNNKMTAIRSATGQLVWEVPFSGGNLIYAKNQIISTGTNTVSFQNALTGSFINSVYLNSLSHNIGAATIRLNDTTYFNCYHGNFR